ncbi:hypothetical protein MMC21_006815 [Puttea exsequens]|nr:hypothetical protein [Puttea exsequens]
MEETITEITEGVGRDTLEQARPPRTGARSSASPDDGHDYGIIGPSDLTATRRSQKLIISQIRSREGKFESKLEYEDLQSTILAEPDDFTGFTVAQRAQVPDERDLDDAIQDYDVNARLRSSQRSVTQLRVKSEHITRGKGKIRWLLRACNVENVEDGRSLVLTERDPSMLGATPSESIIWM